MSKVCIAFSTKSAKHLHRMSYRFKDISETAIHYKEHVMTYLLSVNGSFPVTPYLIWVNRSGADRVIYWVSRYRGRRCHGPMPRQIINKNAIGCAQCGYSCLSCECISIINDHSVSRNDVKCNVKYRCPSLVLCFISCIFGCTEISAVHHKLWKCFFNTLRQRQDGRHYQTAFSNPFSWMKMHEFWLSFHVTPVR